MNAQEFAYWLQGFAELSGDTAPTKAQWKSIREHLGLVFEKVTPPVGLPGFVPKDNHSRPIISTPLTWPPQTSDDSYRDPPRPIVRCSSGQAAGQNDGFGTRTYC